MNPYTEWRLNSKQITLKLSQGATYTVPYPQQQPPAIFKLGSIVVSDFGFS